MAFEVRIASIYMSFYSESMNFATFIFSSHYPQVRNGVFLPDNYQNSRSCKEKCRHHGKTNLGLHSTEVPALARASECCPHKAKSVKNSQSNFW